ncbi:hypothetical protein CHUAL_007993 [Chamberlinius hualienensis]
MTAVTTTTSMLTTTPNSDCYKLHSTATFYNAILSCTREGGELSFLNMSVPIDQDPSKKWYEDNRRLIELIGDFTIWIRIYDIDGTWLLSTMTLKGNYSDIKRYAYENATKMIKNSADFEDFGEVTKSTKQYYFYCELCNPISQLTNSRASESLYFNRNYYWVNPTGKSFVDNDVLCAKDGGMLAPLKNRIIYAFLVGIQSSSNLDIMWIKFDSSKYLVELNATIKMADDIDGDDDKALLDKNGLIKSCSAISADKDYSLQSINCDNALPASICMQIQDACTSKEAVKREGSCYMNATRGPSCSQPLSCTPGYKFITINDTNTYIFQFIKSWSSYTQPSSITNPYDSTQIVCACGK